MGKRSIKENKNIYQVSREEMELTREGASELLEYISADRIEKIESEKSFPHPDEIMAMATAYKAPHLPNYYCSHECPIGQKNVPEVSYKSLSQITLEILASMNVLESEKNRLIEITADGIVSPDEYKDFKAIQNRLNDISKLVDSLKLWIDKAIIDESIDKKALEDA